MTTRKLMDSELALTGRRLSAVINQREVEALRFREAQRAYKVIDERLAAAALQLRRMLDTGEEELPDPEPQMELPTEGPEDHRPETQPEAEPAPEPEDELEPNAVPPDDMDSPADAYTAGFRAGEGGLSERACPYKFADAANDRRISTLRREWQRGFNDGSYDEDAELRRPDPM